MTSKGKQIELRKIKQTSDWADLLYNAKEFQYDGDELQECLTRFYKNVNFRILFFALEDYEKEVRSIKVDNSEGKNE